jgi:hypothetical protein
MELNVCPDASVVNLKDWKRMWIKARDVNGAKTCITN